MPSADVRRMLTLDLDRLSPLAPELIHFDVRLLDRIPSENGQTARLAILRRAEAARLLAAARQAGFEPAALAVRPEGRDGAPQFDFLPQVLEAGGRTAGGGARLRAWWIAAALILANLAILVGRDIIDVSRLRVAVEAQKPGVEAVQRLRRRVASEDARRRDLIARGRRGDPLRLISQLTRALPPTAFVQHFEWNGQTLRLVGFAREGVDMAAAVSASGAVVNPKVLTGAPTGGPASSRSFDITADARPEARR
jgi:hypothetical protein